MNHTVCISKFNFYFHSLVRLRKTNCTKLYPCISVCRICTKQTVTSKWLFKRFYIFEVISGHRPLIQRIFIPEFQYKKVKHCRTKVRLLILHDIESIYYFFEKLILLDNREKGFCVIRMISTISIIFRRIHFLHLESITR